MHWKEAIIYQIYPRSFNDADGDGVGDLMGIIQKLDYLHDLGVDILWLSPIFQSPNADNGYDISDYQAIQPAFGKMDDFDELLEGVHRRGMKLILDLVVNHSSDEHSWFQQSRQSKENPYRDYYIWRAPKDGREPNNWLSFFSGPAWEYDDVTGEYYLHLFARKQPDLNWENPKLRQEVYRMMQFWLNRGVDGFRMDVIPFLSKDPAFPDYPTDRYGDLTLYANGPRIHEFLQEMNRDVLSRYDCVSIGEGFGVTADIANLYVGSGRNELDMIYHFDHAVPRDEINFVEPRAEFPLPELKAVFDRWDAAIDDIGWQNTYFGNHDNPRVVSRFGDTERYHCESATMLATVLLTLRGTPTIYQGDEIGMTNCLFNSIDEFDDVQVRNAYEALVASGRYPAEQFMAAANRIARDHARTPMQWFDSQNAGFTAAKVIPWLKVNPNYSTINVAAQQVAPDSVLNYHKNLIRWRKKTPAMVYGTYRDLLPDHPALYAFERHLNEARFLIIANFSAENTELAIPETLVWEIAMSNYPAPEIDNKTILRPFEARIYQY
ncbi:alpha-glucosidase [Nibrella saemangeumensis]|uniref:Alpha-glucosidase n=1 Tax=Nibrella saemangeumensis TaxID=1084526 RepID=A0ABP8MPN3_9BACT